MSIQSAFQSFIESELESAIISATKASWGGGKVQVELFPDGHYQVIVGGIGNLYDSEGIVLFIPSLGEDEYGYDNGEIENPFFDNAIEFFKESFRNALEESITEKLRYIRSIMEEDLANDSLPLEREAGLVNAINELQKAMKSLD